VQIFWNDNVSVEHGERVARALNAFAPTVTGVLFYRAAPDLALKSNTADFGIVALLDNRDTYLAYADDATHQAIIADLIAPYARARSSTQIPLTA
jgi:hypothetical protein